MIKNRLIRNLALTVAFLVVLTTTPVIALQPSSASHQQAARRYRISGVTTAQQRTAIHLTGAAIDGVGRDFVDVTATPSALDQLRIWGFVVWPLTQPLDFPPRDAAYHSYEEMRAEVQAVAAAHPNVVSLFSLGVSHEGRELLAAKVSDAPLADEDEPEVLFVGHYHAREHLTVEMVLSILHLLVDQYGQPDHAEIDSLVNSREIFLVFDLNPDGGEYDIAAESYRSWRKNRQPSVLPESAGCIGIDLNRNHSYKWGEAYSAGNSGSSGDPCADVYRGEAAASAPEVAAIERFVNSRVVGGVQQITAAISFHTYGEIVLWPYGYTFDDAPEDMPAHDAIALAALGRAMAQSNGYIPQQSSDLYKTNGDFADWAYGTHRIFAYTFEMTGQYQGNFFGFYPPADAIVAETERNQEAVLMLLHFAGCPYVAGAAAVRFCVGGRYDAVTQTWLPIIGRQ